MLSSITPDISFSGYTKGLATVEEIYYDDMGENNPSLVFVVSSETKKKIENRVKIFDRFIMTLDGVGANFEFAEQDDQVRVIATVAREIFLNSSLTALKLSDRVSIGLQSVDSNRYLLEGHSPSIVQLKRTHIQEGPEGVISFTFECQKEQYESIKDLEYVGINGSSFFLCAPSENDGHYYFSIAAWKETQSKTVFGKTDFSVDTQFTLTLPFKG